MPRNANHLAQLAKLAKQIDAAEEQSQGSDTEQSGDKDFIRQLQRVAAVVQDAEQSGSPKLAEVVAKADDVFNDAVSWAYSDAGAFNFLKSFAHLPPTMPLVEDTFKKLGETLGVHGMKELLKIVLEFRGPTHPSELQAMKDKVLPAAWTKSHRPHPKATRLSRFADNFAPTATDATPTARNIYQARCEVASDSFTCPVDAAIAADASALAIAGQGGWKQRDPVLSIYLLDEPQQPNQAAGDGDGDDDDDGERGSSYGNFRNMTIEPGFVEVATELTMDTARRLVLLADSNRIKSFSWGGDVAFDGWKPPRGKNVHTMASGDYDGPLVVLPGGRLARAGKGGAAIWELDALETHKGGRRVGRGRISVEDVWRDNENGEVERSTGSAPSSTVTFANPEFLPGAWYLHAPTGKLLASDNARKTRRYGCYTLDLEHGGTQVSRFLGHGAHVNRFVISAGDANLFATACCDGYARLFDVRHPLPVMTIDAGKTSEALMALEFLHPDGIPTMFTGGERSQSIKAWDIRARGAVYKLATGNNAVNALAWDDRRSTLYAATECSGMDRLGNTHDYRPARIPRWAQLDPDLPGDGMDTDEEDGEDEEDEDEYDSLEDDDDEHYWPKNAFHDERHFGYAYDAGEHVVLRYQFKEEPDPTILPDYGQAMPDRDGYW